MEVLATLRQAWKTYWVFKKHHDAPFWARLVISTVIALSISLALVTLAGLFTGKLGDLSWWFDAIPANLIIGLSIGYTIHAFYRVLAWLLPAAMVLRIAEGQGLRRGLFFSIVGVTGSFLGAAIGLSLITVLLGVDAWHLVSMQPQTLSNFIAITALITAANWIGWRLRSKRQALQMQATESRLRLLQGQIEPHFLFNTLANVQSLMDSDTARAKLMLETFTDYLRSSLGQLRNADSTLGAELEMAHSYLLLLQIRMGDRLSFAIDASPEARGAVLPPLLLQPLLENAIQHGLEPKVEGGSVLVSARLVDQRLEICVDDDGLGLSAARRPLRAGNGMALANIRERLHTRYGTHAEITLHPLVLGTRILLNLPYTASP